jgi:uncharacterized protein
MTTAQTTAMSDTVTSQGERPLPGVVDRITGLDVTRGFAVMGILLMNIIAFAMPGNAYITPSAWGGDTGIDLWTWAINYVLVDSKMRGLFSLMFGASTLLVIERAVAAGNNPAQTHYGRMIVLALFGLLHFFVIWWGDILFNYAAMGMLLYLFRNLSIRALRRWAIGLFILTMLLASQFALLAAADSSFLTQAAPEMATELQEGATGLREEMAPNSEASAEEVALYTSGISTIVSQNIREDYMQPFFGLLLYGPETLMLMLIGMIMFKSGLLRGTWSLQRLDRWAIWCIGIGIAANLALLWWQFASGLDPVILLAATFGVSIPFDVLMSIGYAALFMGLAQRFSDSALIRRVGAAGQAAFTNYLGTSILMTFIFYGWGLGLFGTVNRAACYLFVLGAWAVMLLWSKPWLDRYRYGPLEWLWRSLSRGSLQPMRR